MYFCIEIEFPLNFSTMQTLYSYYLVLIRTNELNFSQLEGGF